MSIDHNDPEVQKLFDVQLAASRAGVDAMTLPANIRSQFDRDLLVGHLSAIERNPTDGQKLISDLASRCTIDAEGKVTLPPDTPIEISEAAQFGHVPRSACSVADRIKARAVLAARVRARETKGEQR